MTMIKEYAIEILKDIPDDKVAPVIEILKGLRVLCGLDEKPKVHSEVTTSARGIFSRYANPALIPLEKFAWGEAVKEKHAPN